MLCGFAAGTAGAVVSGGDAGTGSAVAGAADGGVTTGAFTVVADRWVVVGRAPLTVVVVGPFAPVTVVAGIGCVELTNGPS